MLGALNNITTENEYTRANTLFCEGATKINLEIANAAVYVRMAPRSKISRPGGPLANFGPEVFKGPNTYLLVRNADAVQVRSAVAGKPAQVTIEALGPDD